MDNLGKSVEDEILINDAFRIVEDGEKRKVTLRLLGALAIRIHSGECSELHGRLKRLGCEKCAFTDIDLIAYSKERAKVRSLMEDVFGFKFPNHFMLIHGKDRLLYFHPEGKYHVDIFFDKLQFSHDVNFGSSPDKGRLNLDYPTISLADLFLEKIQIHEINEKDVKDIIVLLKAHAIGLVDQKEIINAKYIAGILAEDWGFWYDAITNLNKVKSFAEKYCAEEMLAPKDFEEICRKIDFMKAVIDAEPKTKNWKKREKDGASKRWWRPVEEVVR
ncbi:MAG: hypothetical protein ACUVT9_07530 [Candidatus Bathycorpusculaceae bacterium]